MSGAKSAGKLFVRGASAPEHAAGDDPISKRPAGVVVHDAPIYPFCDN